MKIFSRNYIFRALAVFALTVHCVSAHADDDENIRKLLGSYEERRNLQDTAGQSSVVVQNTPCPSVDVHILPQMTVYDPLKFDASGTLTQGAWKQTVSAKGCGTDRLLNVFLSKRADSHSLELQPMLPGTTRADFQLQKDTKPYLLMAVGPKEANCRRGFIEDTKFLGFKGDAAFGNRRPWDELWMHVSCTRRAQVTMHFIPDSTGTIISTSLSETKFSSLEDKK